ncbi:MAG: ABC transporter permease [Oryzomonas sp.]|jgi:ABC-type lipoprotein release transport system permease subunit
MIPDITRLMGRLSVTTRYAARNLVRNPRRTLLSVAGITVGCTIALVNIGITKGKTEMFVRNVAEGGIGHVEVVPENWIVSHDPGLRVREWRKILGELRNDPEVVVAAPRVRMQGMLAMGTRVSGVLISGVDPVTEPKALRYVRTLESGRYLKPGDSHAMVIGRTIADRLRVDIGDAVVVTVVDNSGATKSDMFEVIGIVNLGNKQLDSLVCQMTREDAEKLSGSPGVGEIAVTLRDPGGADRFRDRIRGRLPAGDTAWTWAQISPQSEEAVRLNYVFSQIVTVILIMVALMGVASSQLTAVLERKRELAMLSALGMGRISIIRLVISEALTLGTLSVLGTVALAGPITYYFARVGIRLLDAGKSMTALGTVVDPVIHGDFGIWFFVYAAILSYLATVLASVYPAWYAVRLDPAETLRLS